MKILKEFILREIAGEHVLVPTGETTQEFNGLITLTETAGFLWKNIEQAETVQDLVGLMLEEYEVDEETAQKDVEKFVAQLVDSGFVAQK